MDESEVEMATIFNIKSDKPDILKTDAIYHGVMVSISDILCETYGRLVFKIWATFTGPERPLVLYLTSTVIHDDIIKV